MVNCETHCVVNSKKECIVSCMRECIASFAKFTHHIFYIIFVVKQFTNVTLLLTNLSIFQ